MQDLAPVAGDGLDDRRANRRRRNDGGGWASRRREQPCVASRLEFAKCRRLVDAVLHVEREADERDAEQERHAPAPGEEAGWRGERAREQEGEVRSDDADRCADLREAAVKAAAVRGRALDHQQHRPAPLAADREPLKKAQQDEQRRRQRTQRRVRR